MAPRGQQPEQTDKAAEARSAAVEKLEQAESERDLEPSTSVGQALHTAYRENA